MNQATKSKSKQILDLQIPLSINLCWKKALPIDQDNVDDSPYRWSALKLFEQGDHNTGQRLEKLLPILDQSGVAVAKQEDSVTWF